LQQATHVEKTAGTLALTPCVAVPQSIMPAGPRELELAASRKLPIRKVTTPVPVDGGVEGGALAMSPGATFNERRKPNGSACQHRTMAGVQEEAKHAISAMSPLKSCDVEQPPVAAISTRDGAGRIV
jgi:hypothetical protein